MKIEIERAALRSALQDAKGASADRPTMPILSCVVLRAQKDHLLCMATDLELACTVKVEAKVATSGAVAVDTKRLAAIVASLHGETISLTRDDTNRLTIQDGKIVATLAGLGVKDFPKVPDPREATFAPCPNGFLAALTAASAAISADETRIHLYGLLWERKDGVAHAVAADGHRLAHAWTPAPGEDSMIFVPAPGVHALLASKPDETAVQGEVLFARRDTTTLSVRLGIAADFPPWHQVTPTDGDRVRADRVALLDAAQRAVMVGDEMRWTIGKNMVESVACGRLGAGEEIREEIPIERECEDELHVALNPRYVRDALLAAADDGVEILFGGDADPVLFRFASSEHVVMPMRW